MTTKSFDESWKLKAAALDLSKVLGKRLFVKIHEFCKRATVPFGSGSARACMTTNVCFKSSLIRKPPFRFRPMAEIQTDPQPNAWGRGGRSSASISHESIQRSKASPEMKSPFSASTSAASICERLAARAARKDSMALLAREEAERFAIRASSSSRALIFGSRRTENGVVDIRVRLSMREPGNGWRQNVAKPSSRASASSSGLSAL
jgi:hypothetical protein